MTHRSKIGGLLLILAGTCSAEWRTSNGAITFESSLTGTYDSNLRASAIQESDYYLTLQPILRYRSVDSRIKTSASAGVQIRRHLDHTESNREDLDTSVSWTLTREDGHTIGASVDLGYFENSDAVLDLNERVVSKNIRATVSGEILLARNNLLSASVAHRESDRDIGSNQTSESGRVGYRYLGLPRGALIDIAYVHQETASTDALTGQDRIDQTTRSISGTYSHPLYTDALIGLTYGYRWLDRGSSEALFNLEDSSGSFVGVVLDGPFLPRRYFPKTTGTLRLGYQQAETPGMNEQSKERFVGEMTINWQARERTSVGFTARRSQDLSVTDNTVVNTGGGIIVRQDLGHFTTGELELLYTNADYIAWNRVDDRYEARLSTRYSINRTWSSRASYSYLDSRSTTALSSYERHLVSLTATYAY